MQSGMTRGELVKRGAALGAGLLVAGPVRTALAAFDPKAAHHWVSRPDLRPPVLEVLKHTRDASEGSLFLAPLYSAQAQLADKAEGLTPEMWSRFMSMQSPMLQGLMGNYVEQSKNVFLQMQEQMQKNTEQVLGAFGIKRP